MTDECLTEPRRVASAPAVKVDLPAVIVGLAAGMVLVSSFGVPWPVRIWYWVGDLAWFLPSVLVIGPYRHCELPYPGSLQSWRAMANEAAAPASLIAVACARIPPVLDFALRRWSSALALHRAVASRKKELSFRTVAALSRLHARLAFWANIRFFRSQSRLSDTDREHADLIDPSSVSHARLALTYAGFAEVGTLSPCASPVLTINLFLACVHLIAARRKASLCEVALSYLADAVKTSWALAGGVIQPPEHGDAAYIGVLPSLAQRAGLDQDPRFQTLMQMIEQGATLQRLAEVRSEIHVDPDDVAMLPEEREEREWTEALRKSLSLPSGNDATCLPYLPRWNWGAVCLSWIWAFAHRLPGWGLVGLVLWFIPLLNLGYAILLGALGSELAWRARPFSSLENLRATERVWTWCGIPLVGFFLLSGPLLLVTLLATFVASAISWSLRGLH